MGYTFHSGTYSHHIVIYYELPLYIRSNRNILQVRILISILNLFLSVLRLFPSFTCLTIHYPLFQQPTPVSDSFRRNYQCIIPVICKDSQRDIVITIEIYCEIQGVHNMGILWDWNNVERWLTVKKSRMRKILRMSREAYTSRGVFILQYVGVYFTG